MVYNWQQNDWRNFQYKAAEFEEYALIFMEIAGQSSGYLNSLRDSEKETSLIALLVKEAIKTSAIEGEFISRADVISSIRKNLGFTTPQYRIKDKRSEGIALLLVKSRESFAEDLTEIMLFDWHKQLMLGNYSIEVGVFRHHNEPMQVISGAIGKEEIHFEAPPSAQVVAEMTAYLDWFNATKPNGSAPIVNLLIRSGIAHLYFETIHPFEDGNGRIGRVIAEKVLSQGLKKPILLSLSTVIEANKPAYYKALKQAQRTNDLTHWLHYFCQVVIEAQRNFIATVAFSLKKAAFFDENRDKLNEAQLKVVARMLEHDEDNFLGGMNAKKYQSISQTSKATATRHLQDLVEKEILVAKNGGRSTQYQVNLSA